MVSTILIKTNQMICGSNDMKQSKEWYESNNAIVNTLQWQLNDINTTISNDIPPEPSNVEYKINNTISWINRSCQGIDFTTCRKQLQTFWVELEILKLSGQNSDADQTPNALLFLGKVELAINPLRRLVALKTKVSNYKPMPVIQFV